MIQRFPFIDTHTAGEPTRIVLNQYPYRPAAVDADSLAAAIQLDGGTMNALRADFDARFDDYRRALVCEPRGSDVMVGALLTEPKEAACQAGVIFFNNVGSLGMCGHGAMGVAVALRFLRCIAAGVHRLDTPVGPVTLELLDDHRVRLTNVPSYRYRAQVEVALDSRQIVRGDIAWGGNWFFICEDHGQRIASDNLAALQAFAQRVRIALLGSGIFGQGGAEIDHIELIGPPTMASADAKNYVLCPGGAYDRSPCGTGTSAKVACLAADGKLLPGARYCQESIVGSLFEATYTPLSNGRVLPVLTGSAFVTSHGDLLLDPADPFMMGLL